MIKSIISALFGSSESPPPVYTGVGTGELAFLIGSKGNPQTGKLSVLCTVTNNLDYNMMGLSFYFTDKQDDFGDITLATGVWPYAGQSGSSYPQSALYMNFASSKHTQGSWGSNDSSQVTFDLNASPKTGSIDFSGVLEATKLQWGAPNDSQEQPITVKFSSFQFTLATNS